jgi:hypothetical protein
MIWNTQSLALRSSRLDNDVAADLMNLSVAPSAAERLHELPIAAVSSGDEYFVAHQM